jgi:hypothetical protein
MIMNISSMKLLALVLIARGTSSHRVCIEVQYSCLLMEMRDLATRIICMDAAACLHTAVDGVDWEGSQSWLSRLLLTSAGSLICTAAVRWHLHAGILVRAVCSYDLIWP